jgi:leucyl-tRNA synthetase
MINSGNYTGMKSEEFRKRVIKDLEKIGLGKNSVSYKIRDWVFSRQRYWGNLYHCAYRKWYRSYL